MPAVLAVWETLNAFVTQYSQAVSASEHSLMLFLQLSATSGPAKGTSWTQAKAERFVNVMKEHVAPSYSFCRDTFG